MLYTFLIGWLYLLPRVAFVPRAWTCSACGQHFRRRTMGSYLALLVLGLLVLWGVIIICHSGAAE